MNPSTTWRSFRANTAGIDCTWNGGGDTGVLVHIDLDELHRPVLGLDGLLQDGAQGAAGPAPRCPQVHDDGDLVGAHENVLLEGGVGDVDHAEDDTGRRSQLRPPRGPVGSVQP